MSGTDRGRLAAAAKTWALTLTGRASVTGSADEASFGPWLAETLLQHPAFQGRAEIWTLPVAVGDPRHCVFLLLRGSGRRTAILTGHYDTVSVDDYGELRALATEPELLAHALADSLAKQVGTAATARARADLAGGDFLPGRGLLDMKAGLAAGLAVSEAFADSAAEDGNLLFIAVPDEENNSAGARAVARALPALAGDYSLDLIAAINLDAIADDGDGTMGRVVALGTVGKLPTALVIGTPTHSGFPLNGLNAGPLAAAIAARVEWAPELTDKTGCRPGTPPSLLSLRDSKIAYDVTTPAAAFLTFNVLSHGQTATDVLDRFDALCAEAAAAHLDALNARVGAQTNSAPVALHRYAAVEAAALAQAEGNAELLQAQGERLAGITLSLPERCRLKTEYAWELSGLAGPAIVTSFGSIPYLPTNLSNSSDAMRLREAAELTAELASERHGSAVSTTPTFAGISDMSFFGEADTGGLPVVAANTPLWQESVSWPESGGVANIPTINIGPWGRDYHTPLERLHEPYAFGIVPALLLDVLADLGIVGTEMRVQPIASGASVAAELKTTSNREHHNELLQEQ